MPKKPKISNPGPVLIPNAPDFEILFMEEQIETASFILSLLYTAQVADDDQAILHGAIDHAIGWRDELRQRMATIRPVSTAGARAQLRAALLDIGSSPGAANVHAVIAGLEALAPA